MKVIERIMNGKRGSWSAFVIPLLACVGMVTGFAAPYAQRPATFQHVRELALYLDSVKIAEPVVVGHVAVYPVLAHTQALKTGQWMTLDSARSTNTLLIRERRASVNLFYGLIILV